MHSAADVTSSSWPGEGSSSADGRLVFVPVRHHSPACARVVRQIVRAVRPSAVLIEGPSDFNSRIDELYLEHTLPIAIYSFYQTVDGARSGAFYPFCVYSPEWQALLAAREVGARVEFIDLPWACLRGKDEPVHRYSDADLRGSRYVAELCTRLGVENLDALWDMMVEIDPELTPDGYLERAGLFCRHIRDVQDDVTESDRSRERFMAARVRACLDACQGPVVVVTGGFHTPAIRQLLLAAPDFTDSSMAESELPQGMERGIALTPYSYERLDSLTGYDSGMPSPGFYDKVWSRRQENQGDAWRLLLTEVAKDLRTRKQTVSTADLIAVEGMARALADLRGHSEIWRTDLVDAIVGSLVKDEVQYGATHPLLDAVYQALRGSDRGALAHDAPVPPLVRDIRRKLIEADLEPQMAERHVDLDLTVARDLTRSRLLHILRGLDTPGFLRTYGADLVSRDDLSELREGWQVTWAPQIDARCIENAVYGATLDEAAAARLQERANSIERSAAGAALLLLDAALMGLGHMDDKFHSRMVEIVRQDGDFYSVTDALGHVLYLYAYDEVLGTAGNSEIREVLRETFHRSLWLFEGLGSAAGMEGRLLRALSALVETSDRCARRIGLDPDDLLSVLRRVAGDNSRDPATRGATLGVLWLLGSTDADRVLEDLRYWRDPAMLGDFLTGLLWMAREPVQRHPAVIIAIDEIVMGLDETEFLNALPPLRLGFSCFTPREKAHLVRALLAARAPGGDLETPDLHLDVSTAVRALRLETALFAALARYRIRPLTAPPQSTEPPEQGSGGSLHSPADRPHDSTTEHQERPQSAIQPLQRSAPPPSSPGEDRLRRMRWRLILGGEAEDLLGRLPQGPWQERDRALGFLFDRESGKSRNTRRKGSGSLDESELTVPDWVNSIHDLFPQRAVERLERDAIERYRLDEVVTNPEVLARAKPNLSLLKAVLRTKHLMNQEVLGMARTLVRKVIEEMMEKLAREVQSPFGGSIDRRRRSFLKSARNLDVTTTIRRNLRHYDPAARRLCIQTPYFFSRVRRQVDRWQVIILVDQSGSMAGSVIHSAVTASIFFGVKSLKTHLVVFDTSIVDLTEDCSDPVETLLKVQLGGGTDIAQALAYASTLVDNPRRTIVVLITDFEEGAPVGVLMGTALRLLESGVTLLGLAALDEVANPCFNRDVAGQLVAMGAHVAAMTPGELAAWVAEKVR